MCGSGARRRIVSTKCGRLPGCRSHGVDGRARRRVANSRQQQQQAIPTHFVSRVLEDAEKRQDVFDVGSLEEFESAPLLERNLPIGELDLEVGRHVAGAKENGDLAQRCAFLVQLQNSIDDELRLLLLVAGGDEPRRLTTSPLRPEVLRKSLGSARYERIGDAQDRLRRPIILLERNHRCGGKLFGKVEDVSEIGAAKRVDALRVIADDSDVLVRTAHSAENARLKDVGVLILVDEDVVVQPRDLLPKLRRRLEQKRPEEQKVIVVDEISFLLPSGVIGIDPGEILEVVDELRIRIANDVLDRDLGVEVPGVDVLERLLFREALRFRGVSELSARQLHQVGGVALIHDGKILRQASSLSVATQQAVSGGVERPAVNALAVAAHQPLGARQHFLRGASREGEKQNSLGGNAALDQVRDAIYECAGLSRPGTGNDQQRAVDVCRCCRLLGI